MQHCYSAGGVYSSPMPGNLASEPMNVGSPTSSIAPPGPQYLPSFLMGDSSSPIQSIPHTTLSGNRISPYVSPNQSQFVQSRLSDIKPVPLDRHSSRRHASPPTQSLWTSNAASIKPTSDILNASMRRNTPTTLPNILINRTQSTLLRPGLLSPSVASPYITSRSESKQESDSLGSAPNCPDDESSTWITVFGYPSSQASFILQQFSHFGAVEKFLITNDGNWMHIKYQNKIQAKCAMNKNGRVFSGNVMIGVRRCTDTEVMLSSAAIAPSRSDLCPSKMATDEPKVELCPPASGFRSPSIYDSPLRDLGNKREELMNRSFTLSQSASKPEQRTTGLARHNSMRPLAGVYRPPCSQVSRNTQAHSFRTHNGGSKTSGLFSKAFDYVFGWN